VVVKQLATAIGACVAVWVLIAQNGSTRKLT